MRAAHKLWALAIAIVVLLTSISSCDDRWLRQGEGFKCFWHSAIGMKSYVTRDLAPDEVNIGLRLLYREPHYHGYPLEFVRYSQAIPCAPDGYWSFIGYSLIRSEALVTSLANQPEAIDTNPVGEFKLLFEKAVFPLAERENHIQFATATIPTLEAKNAAWAKALSDYDRLIKTMPRPEWVTDAMVAPDRLLGKGALLGSLSHAEYLKKEERFQGWILRGDKPDELLFISHDPELAIGRNVEVVRTESATRTNERKGEKGPD